MRAMNLHNSKKYQLPFLCCWKSAGLLMMFRDFLQVMTQILHKSLYRLAKEKGLKRTFQALKVQYLWGNLLRCSRLETAALPTELYP